MSSAFRITARSLSTSALAGLQASLARLQGAFGPAGNDISGTLSRYHQIDIMQQRNQANQLDAKAQLPNVEDVDVAATTVDLQMQEVAYQAALGASARSIQPSLLDFLQ